MTNRQIQNRLYKMFLGEMEVEDLQDLIQSGEIGRQQLIEQTLIFAADDGDLLAGLVVGALGLA